MSPPYAEVLAVASTPLATAFHALILPVKWRAERDAHPPARPPPPEGDAARRSVSLLGHQRPRSARKNHDKELRLRGVIKSGLDPLANAIYRILNRDIGGIEQFDWGR